MEKKKAQFWGWILLIALSVFIGLFFAQKILFVTADLGRHVKNGEVFLKQGFPISTNFYSYTEPDFPVVNHHWGAGLIFFFLWKWFGFEGLSALHVVIYLAAFLFFFKIAERSSSFSYALFFSILSIPLFTRNEKNKEIIKRYELPKSTFIIS